MSVFPFAFCSTRISSTLPTDPKPCDWSDKVVGIQIQNNIQLSARRARNGCHLRGNTDSVGIHAIQQRRLEFPFIRLRKRGGWQFGIACVVALAVKQLRPRPIRAYCHVMKLIVALGIGQIETESISRARGFNLLRQRRIQIVAQAPALSPGFFRRVPPPC